MPLLKLRGGITVNIIRYLISFFENTAEKDFNKELNFIKEAS